MRTAPVVIVENTHRTSKKKCEGSRTLFSMLVRGMVLEELLSRIVQAVAVGLSRGAPSCVGLGTAWMDAGHAAAKSC